MTSTPLLAGAYVVFGILVLAANGGSGHPVDDQIGAEPSVHGQRDSSCGWEAPVDAPVTDPFRPPPHPYGPGNRGLEYGTVSGQEVVAVDAGLVGFVGPVGGTVYVVIGHSHGVKSTYGPLEEVWVSTGHRVGRRQLIGQAAPAMHLTARVGTQYLDPSVLLDGGCVRFRLVE